MKKICLVIFLFFGLHLNAIANANISFIYINGSNIKDEKIKKWYLKGVYNFHPSVKHAFEQNPFTYKYLLKCGGYCIEKKPIIFSWGDNNHHNSTVKNGCQTSSKGLITWIASTIRIISKNVLHDIIWIQNHYNMSIVLEKLHKSVTAEVQKGNKIVLYGYSSGSFITYEYLLSRSPYINVEDFFNSVKITKGQRDFVTKHPMKNTCISALEKKLAVFSIDEDVIIQDDLKSFENGYMNLNSETDAACIPDDAVLGIINIASPFTLFKPDISDPNYILTYYNKRLYKYIIENGMFWLTVNYREDALSFPSVRNLTIQEIANITNLAIEPCYGFIYDQSNTKGGMFAITHLHYLTQPKTLSKSVVKAYENGYRYQYGNKFK